MNCERAPGRLAPLRGWLLIEVLLTVKGTLKHTIDIYINVAGVVAVLTGVAGDEEHSEGGVAKAETATIYCLNAKTRGLEIVVACEVVQLGEICVVVFATILAVVTMDGSTIGKFDAVLFNFNNLCHG